jgi:hypothetical protein
MLVQVLLDETHCPLPHLRGIPCPFVHGSNLSTIGASGNLGAIQTTRGAHGSRETPESDVERAEPLVGGENLSWEPLRIERVCEVKYDHLQGDRFRHAAVFLR